MTVTRPGSNSAIPRDPDADRLSAAWNEIVAGLEPLAEDDLTATARSLHAGAPDHRPTSTFRDNLRETLMQTAVPMEMPGLRQPSRLRDQAREPRLRIPSIVGGHAVRWTAIAATIALVLTTLAAGYLGGLYPQSNQPEPTGLAAPFTGTPTSVTPAANPCAEAVPYIPCGYVAGMMGTALIVPANLPADALRVSKVQMQAWEIPGSETVTFTDPIKPATGVAIDVVVGGAYQATFSVPVVIARPSPEGSFHFQYPEAGDSVELSRGDSVTYEIGTRREVKNRFSAAVLELKTILFYEGDASPQNTVGGGQYQAKTDADGTLPTALSDYPSSGVTVTLTYVHVPPDDSFSPQMPNVSAVLGPVGNIEPQDSPKDGFVVWLSAQRG